jgi:hypothetical protein
MDIEVGGFLGLIIFAFDIWAIVHVIGSRTNTAAQVVWIVGILLLPVVGFLLWLIFGPRTSKTVAHSR